MVGDIRGAWSDGPTIRGVLDPAVDGTGGRGLIKLKFPNF